MIGMIIKASLRGCEGCRMIDAPQSWDLELMSKPRGFFKGTADGLAADSIPTRPLLPGVDVCLVTVHKVMPDSTSITQRPASSSDLARAGMRREKNNK